jgi:hypothetical protein
MEFLDKFFSPQFTLNKGGSMPSYYCKHNGSNPEEETTEETEVQL